MKLTDDLKYKIDNANTVEEKLKLIEDSGLQLSDEELESVIGGNAIRNILAATMAATTIASITPVTVHAEEISDNQIMYESVESESEASEEQPSSDDYAVAYDEPAFDEPVQESPFIDAAPAPENVAEEPPVEAAPAPENVAEENPVEAAPAPETVAEEVSPMEATETSATEELVISTENVEDEISYSESVELENSSSEMMEAEDEYTRFINEERNEEYRKQEEEYWQKKKDQEYQEYVNAYMAEYEKVDKEIRDHNNALLKGDIPEKDKSKDIKELEKVTKYINFVETGVDETVGKVLKDQKVDKDSRELVTDLVKSATGAIPVTGQVGSAAKLAEHAGKIKDAKTTTDKIYQGVLVASEAVDIAAAFVPGGAVIVGVKNVSMSLVKFTCRKIYKKHL